MLPIVTQPSDSLLEAAVTEATRNKQAPAYTGSKILEGELVGPAVGVAAAKES
jgi:hypothetical protein